MMRRTQKIMCILALLVLVPTTTLGTMKYELEARTHTSWGKDYEPDVTADDLKLNLRDCTENTVFKFTVYDLPSDVGNSELYIYMGTDCQTSDSCESTSLTAEAQDFEVSARELLLVTSGSDCAGVGSGSTKTWAALVTNGDKNTATWAENPISVSWDTTLPPTPNNLTATPAEQKVALDWDMEGVAEEEEGDGGTSTTGSSADANRYIILYWDVSSSTGGSDSDGGVGADADADADADTDTDTDADLDGGLDSGASGDTDTDTDTDTDADIDTDTDAVIDTDAGTDTSNDAGTEGSSWRLNGAADDPVECPTGGFEKGDTYDPNASYEQKTVASTDGTKSQISGLTDGVTYKFAVVARDDHFNYSVISETVCAIPNETVDFFEEYMKAGGKGGKFCFVATAAFDSYDHPVVKVLRRFRDDFIEPIPGGKTLIDAYYSIGPSVAAVVDSSSALGGLTRGVLTVFAGTTIPLTAMGPVGTALALTALVFGFVFLRRRKRN